MAAKAAIQPLTDEEQASAAAWLETHGASLPPAVHRLAQVGLALAAHLAKPKATLAAFRRALGISPRTERSGKSGDPLDGVPGSGTRKRMPLRERLQFRLDQLNKACDWHCAQRRKRRAETKKLRKQLQELDAMDDEVELTEEEEKAACAREQQEFRARCAEGQRCDLECSPTTESLIRSLAAADNVEPVRCEVALDELPRGITIAKTFEESRERIDVKFVVTTLDITVQKAIVNTPDGQLMVSASTDEYGPPRMRITWDFLANLALMAGGQCVPFNRFAMMASTPRKIFKASEIGRYFKYVAERMLPVYCALGRGLANAEILCGDDTPTRVLEVTGAQESQPAVLPWARYATKSAANQTAAVDPDPGIGVILAQHFGFVSQRKDGTGDKKAFNTTVLSGRADNHDPRSAIVFYRSHLGGLGNLLDAVLVHRNHGNRKLVIQSDLSTTNLLSNPELVSSMEVTLAGCASHARRPFALHADDEPQICDWILHEFKGIALYEKMLTHHGRNRENVLAVRGVDCAAMWESIRESCEILLRKWSRTTPLGEGARYVIKHFDKLTHYLKDPRLPSSNNFSERQLRYEKLLQNNAMFRQTLHGRFAFDIVRTCLQTATAACVDPQAYLLWVLRMPPDVVATEPEEFTPRAFASLPRARATARH